MSKAKSRTVKFTRQPLFNPETVKKLTSTPLPLKVRLVLPFLRSRYAAEGDTTIRYKKYRGTMYILEVSHALTRQQEDKSV